MAKKQLLPGFTRIPGLAERVRTPTGETISDRAYKRLAREISGTTPITSKGKTLTNEALSKFNKETNPVEAFARPARGRKSALKLPEANKKIVANTRKIAEQKAIETHKQKVAQQKIERKVSNILSRKQKATPNKITLSNFRSKKKGVYYNRATHVKFSDLSQAQSVWETAKAFKGSEFWGMGANTVNLNTGKLGWYWLYGLADFSISPKMVMGEIKAEINEKLNNHASGNLAITEYVLHIKLNKEFHDEHVESKRNEKPKTQNKKKILRKTQSKKR